MSETFVSFWHRVLVKLIEFDLGGWRDVKQRVFCFSGCCVHGIF